MKILRSMVVLTLLATAAAPGFAHHMAVVVSQQNSIQNLTSTELAKILLGEARKWPDGRNITLVLHRLSPGEAITIQHLNKMSAAQWQTWISEHKDAVRILDSDEQVLAFVAASPGAVGLIDVRSLNDRVKIVHIDGKLPLESGYLPH